MSDSTGQLSNQQLFDAAVRNFEKKLPARFRALMPYKDGIAGLRAKSASFRTIAQNPQANGRHRLARYRCALLPRRHRADAAASEKPPESCQHSDRRKTRADANPADK